MINPQFFLVGAHICRGTHLLPCDLFSLNVRECNICEAFTPPPDNMIEIDWLIQKQLGGADRQTTHKCSSSGNQAKNSMALWDILRPVSTKLYLRCEEGLAWLIPCLFLSPKSIRWSNKKYCLFLKTFRLSIKWGIQSLLSPGWSYGVYPCVLQGRFYTPLVSVQCLAALSTGTTTDIPNQPCAFCYSQPHQQHCIPHKVVGNTEFSLGGSLSLFLFLIDKYNLRAWLAVLEVFQNKVMCTVFYGISMFYWSTAIATAESETEGQNNSLCGRSHWVIFSDLCYAVSQTGWSEQSLLALKSMNLCSDYTSENEQPKLKVVIYWMLATGSFLFLNKELLLKGSL